MSNHAPAPRSPWMERLAAGGAMAGVALALSRSIPEGLLVRGDSPELTLVALTQGVAHAPGYPLWTRLAGVWLSLCGDHPGVALSWMGLFLMVGAVGILVGVLCRWGARPMVAAGVAACWALLPPHWGAVLAPEVYALELLLWVSTLAALRASGRSSALLAGILAVLAAAHRPIGLVLVATAAMDRSRSPHRSARIGGIFAGGVLTLALYADLGRRVVAPETAWVDAMVQQDPVGWAFGAGFSEGHVGGNALLAWLQAWGLQSIVWCVGAAGLVWVPSARSGGVETTGLGVGAVVLVVWSSLWVVPDPETTALPILLLASVGWARTLGSWRLAGPCTVGTAVLMGVLNQGAMTDTTSARAELQAAAALPPTTVVLVGDWTWRTALVLEQSHLQVVPWGTGDTCGSVRQWLMGGQALWAPEQRATVERGDRVVAWGPQARACVAAEGLAPEPMDNRIWVGVKPPP